MGSLYIVDNCCFSRFMATIWCVGRGSATPGRETRFKQNKGIGKLAHISESHLLEMGSGPNRRVS